MANLKEIKTRIDSVASMEQITSAMKMVSASKLRKSQNLVLKLRPYCARMQSVVAHTLKGGIAGTSPFAQEREVKNVLVVAVSSNSGLCGSFNATVAKEVIQHLQTLATDSSVNISLVCVGRKVGEYMTKHTDYKVVGHYDELLDKLSYEQSAKLAEQFLNAFLKKQYDRVDVISNHFINAAVYKTLTTTLVPFAMERLQEETATITADSDCIFLPNHTEVEEALIPKIIKLRLYQFFLESLTAEHGARMTSMHKATENASQMLKDLKLSFNKARQAAITNEIIEITNGANALSA
ncbi:ATP synthase gamma chain [Bacteroidia bacterium]|nr:ATP synthase gamma chain [Bacteroidia bacterium]